MKIPLALDRADLLLLRRSALVFAFSITAACLLYYGADYLNAESSSALQQAQANYAQAATSVEEIAVEEATILRYIDRYRVLESNGVMAAENRLDMLETIANIRFSHKLFPVALSMDEQIGTRLEYDPADPAPGEPVDLRSTQIGLQWPLLHEGDFTTLMDGLLNSPGLFQVRQCKLSSSKALTAEYDVVEEYLAADCQVLWYSFDLSPVITVDPYQ